MWFTLSSSLVFCEAVFFVNNKMSEMDMEVEGSDGIPVVTCVGCKKSKVPAFLLVFGEAKDKKSGRPIWQCWDRKCEKYSFVESLMKGAEYYRPEKREVTPMGRSSSLRSLRAKASGVDGQLESTNKRMSKMALGTNEFGGSNALPVQMKKEMKC